MSTLNGGTHSGESTSGFDLTRELEESIGKRALLHNTSFPDSAEGLFVLNRLQSGAKDVNRPRAETKTPPQS